MQVKPFLRKQPFTEGVETSVYLFKNRHNFPVQWQSDLEIFTLHGNLYSIFTKMVILGLFLAIVISVLHVIKLRLRDANCLGVIF